ncbi:hypothetical protein VP01_1682g4 [Puccinia sorghi]|uniref:Uncharacterized protein n=1 Tax=Puccinia sorghi TaxID=27349 RepID=A0A0L6VFW4_9BASI|nr:hypothetical protein VP01_1682g4 [Puccinia sorghi]
MLKSSFLSLRVTIFYFNVSFCANVHRPLCWLTLQLMGLILTALQKFIVNFSVTLIISSLKKWKNLSVVQHSDQMLYFKCNNKIYQTETKLYATFLKSDTSIFRRNLIWMIFHFCTLLIELGENFHAHQNQPEPPDLHWIPRTLTDKSSFHYPVSLSLTSKYFFALVISLFSWALELFICKNYYYQDPLLDYQVEVSDYTACSSPLLPRVDHSSYTKVLVWDCGFAFQYFIETSSICSPSHSHSSPSVLSTVFITLDMDIRDGEIHGTCIDDAKQKSTRAPFLLFIALAIHVSHILPCRIFGSLVHHFEPPKKNWKSNGTLCVEQKFCFPQIIKVGCAAPGCTTFLFPDLIFLVSLHHPTDSLLLNKVCSFLSPSQIFFFFVFSFFFSLKLVVICARLLVVICARSCAPSSSREPLRSSKTMFWGFDVILFQCVLVIERRKSSRNTKISPLGQSNNRILETSLKLLGKNLIVNIRGKMIQNFMFSYGNLRRLFLPTTPCLPLVLYTDELKTVTPSEKRRDDLMHTYSSIAGTRLRHQGDSIGIRNCLFNLLKTTLKFATTCHLHPKRPAVLHPGTNKSQDELRRAMYQRYELYDIFFNYLD